MFENKVSSRNDEVSCRAAASTNASDGHDGAIGLAVNSKIHILQYQVNNSQVIQGMMQPDPLDPHEVIEQSIQADLPHGAGNRRSDITRTDGESAVRVHASQNLGRGNRGEIRHAASASNAPRELLPHLETALRGIMVGAGNCMEHAAIAFFRAMAQYPGRRVLLMSVKGMDHAFVLVCDGNNLSQGTVIDGWQTSENGRTLAESEWRESGVEQIVAESNAGVDFLAIAQPLVTTNVGELDTAMNRSREQIVAGGNPFTVYEGL